MANLQKLQEFAATHDFGLTNPLSHDQVAQLAAYWFPEMRFYQDERFHPISLDEVFSMVEDLFDGLPPTAQDEWRVTKFIRTGANAGEELPFDPPVVHVPDGVIQVGSLYRAAVRVLNDGTSAREALSQPDVDSSAVITHGASFRTSNQYLGAQATLRGGNVASAEDPFMPRTIDPDAPPPPPPPPYSPPNSRITSMAALLNLLELLKYELTVAEAGDDYPPDGMRGGFDISGSLLRPASTQSPPLSPDVQRQILLGLIAAHESGGSVPAPPLPPGWELDRVAWDAVTRYAFLEYYFFYAYNDFERYQIALFDNEHEGDDEGCCLVFDRNVINLAAASSDPDFLLRAVPHSIITSVHEEYQDADIFKFVPPPIPSPDNPNPLARDAVNFTVYVAGGSHATYLTPGNHDIVDFGDTWGYVEENASILLVLAPVLAIAIILAIIEHFIDTEDFTSDDGVRTGPVSVVGNHPSAVANRLIVLPMSADNHIYRPANEATEELLRLRAFAGKWGGHDGIVDNSPAFKAKTGRYFRKLVNKL